MVSILKNESQEKLFISIINEAFSNVKAKSDFNPTDNAFGVGDVIVLGGRKSFTKWLIETGKGKSVDFDYYKGACITM